MSKERARRRAQREAAAAQQRERHLRQQRRRRTRQSLTRPLTRLRLPRRGRAPASRLAVQRRRQNGGLLAVLFAGHLALWLATSQWSWRLGVLVLTVLAWPVLVTVLFDRRAQA